MPLLEKMAIFDNKTLAFLIISGENTVDLATGPLYRQSLVELVRYYALKEESHVGISAFTKWLA